MEEIKFVVIDSDYIKSLQVTEPFLKQMEGVGMTTEIEIHEQSTELAEKAMHLVIIDQESFEAAGAFNGNIEKMKKEMKAYHKPLKAATHAAHKAATTRENDDLAPLESAGAYLRSIRSDYRAKEDEKQRKAQAKKDAAAERKAEKEREKLRKKAAAEKDEEKKAEIEEKIEEVYVEPVIVESTIKKAEGVSWVEDIEVEVDSINRICKCVAEGIIPENVVEIKKAKLKQWAKSFALKPGQHVGFFIKKTKNERVRTA